PPWRITRCWRGCGKRRKASAAIRRPGCNMAGRSAGDLPSHGTPDGSAEKRDASGNVIQRRYDGTDGRAVKNIDFGHDHTGVGHPHAHDWDWTKTPPRHPPRALRRGE